MTIKQILDGLKFTRDMWLFDPSTGNVLEKEQMNDLDRTSIDAIEGAIEFFEKYQSSHEKDKCVIHDR